MFSNLTKRAAGLALAAAASIGLAMPALFAPQTSLTPSAKAYSAEGAARLGAQICSKGGTVAVTVEAVNTDVQADIFFTRDLKEQTVIGSNQKSSELKLDTKEE